MKSQFLTLILTGFVALSAQAKLSDFNSLIDENSKAQKELHTNLREALDETRLAVVSDNKQDRVIVENSTGINVPTKKGLLTFSKEKVFHRASESKAQKRLAQEIDSSN